MVLGHAGKVGFWAAVMIVAAGSVAVAQAIDCGRLQAQIASADQGGGRAGQYAAAAQRQRAELDRTVAYARQLGCDRAEFPLFGAQRAPQCAGLNARIGQMQANLGQLQAGGGGQRADLVARYNAYCRGQPQQQAAVQPRQRNFFEQLFGGGDPQPPVQQARPPSGNGLWPGDPDGGDTTRFGDAEEQPRGGSQAVCVRRCDGAFFPVNYSSKRGESMADLCQALCPAAEMAVFSRNPNREIQTAVSSDGTPYADLPNALKYQKKVDTSCTCRAPGQSWSQALGDAERVLGRERKGDIFVTPEKSAELSRPKADPKAKSSKIVPDPKGAIPAADDPTAYEATVGAQVPTASKDSAGIATGDMSKDKALPEGSGKVEDLAGPEGVKRRVRIVGPTP